MNSRILTTLVFFLSSLSAFPVAAEQGSVARGVYTSGVQDREPVDQLTSVPKDLGRVYYYTELRNLDGQTVTHRWLHGAQTVFEVPFEVKAARWRVWSSKEIHPGLTGEWTVVVVDGGGKELNRSSLKLSQ